jgi:hypothetical protein
MRLLALVPLLLSACAVTVHWNVDVELGAGHAMSLGVPEGGVHVTNEGPDVVVVRAGGRETRLAAGESVAVREGNKLTIETFGKGQSKVRLRSAP